MGRKGISKKQKRSSVKPPSRKKKVKKIRNENIEVVEEEEEEDEEDEVEILMRKCRMTRHQVICEHQKFLEKRPYGEMSKEDFLLENEVLFYLSKNLVSKIVCFTKSWPNQN